MAHCLKTQKKVSFEKWKYFFENQVIFLAISIPLWDCATDATLVIFGVKIQMRHFLNDFQTLL